MYHDMQIADLDDIHYTSIYNGSNRAPKFHGPAGVHHDIVITTGEQMGTHV